MSDTLHKAAEKFQRNLEEHVRRYESDLEYRKWFDSLDTKQKPIFAVGGW